MAERSTGLVAALVVVAVLAVGTFSFMFAMGVEKDDKEQLIAAVQGAIEGDDEKNIKGLSTIKEELTQELARSSRELDTVKGELEGAKRDRDEMATWRKGDLEDAEKERKEIQPAVRALDEEIRRLFKDFDEVLDTMKESRENFEADERRLLDEIQIKGDELVRTVRTAEEKEKEVDNEIAVLEAKLAEVRERLKIVQAEALRGKTISDAGGIIMRVADRGVGGRATTNFVVVNLGSADRIRKGLKFQVWTLRRGYGLGWVQVRGRDFVGDAIMPGDRLVIGRDEEAERYHIVSVGISREAEQKGLGLASHRAKDTLKIIGPGVTPDFPVAGVEWKVERVSEVAPPDELGAEIKGMIEITEVGRHSSGAVILPERTRNPVCSQCGWEAYKPDMRHCPFCYLGDNLDEVQPLDATVKGLLSSAQDPFKPIMAGDRLSNPYFAPNRELVFVLGSEPVRETREHMKAFIEYSGGRVVGGEQLLVRPDQVDVDIVREIMPYEIHYLIPGKGPDSKKLLGRARDLGIRIMREQELYEFFGEID